MVTKPSSDATTMAWNWVIQSISRFKQVDSSTLTDLVEKAPAVSVDIGKDAKEMVSLRILESLFLQGNEDTVDFDSVQNAKFIFDSSEHCEDILHKILQETSEPITELERRKWNIHPFIIQKLASFRKPPLQKLKEILLKGNHSILESLKEMSKLQESPLDKTEHVEESNIGITDDIGRKEHEMTNLPSAKDLEEITLMDHVEHIASKSHEQSCDHANIDHGQQQFTSKDDDEDDDNNTDDDDMTDIAAKKEAFLSQDFMSTVDFTETYLCMKCNKSGQLLVCGSDACPFRVHSSCLDSATTLDETETFYCPFCSYSHAISKYLEVKKKASLARKDLQGFLSSRVKHRPTISIKTGSRFDETCEKLKSIGDEHATSSGKDDDPVDSVHQSTGQAGISKQLSKEKKSPGSSTLKRARKQEPQYSSPTLTLARRKNLFWDKSEEEILKIGVQRFSCADNKRIPWKKILDFGQDVFDKSRTAIDLKDKWRNMCKENTAIKKQKL